MNMKITHNMFMNVYEAFYILNHTFFLQTFVDTGFFFVYNDHDYDLVVPEGFCLKSNNKLVLEFQHYLNVFVLFCLFLVLCCVRVYCGGFFLYILLIRCFHKVSF